jgi:hypothetical protein
MPAPESVIVMIDPSAHGVARSGLVNSPAIIAVVAWLDALCSIASLLANAARN